MISPVESKVLSELKKLEHDGVELPEVTRFHAELLRIQGKVKSRITIDKPGYSSDLIRDRLVRGMHLLLFEDFSPDWHLVQTTFQKILAWTGKGLRASAGRDRSLREISRDVSHLRELAGMWYLGHASASVLGTLQVDGELLSSIMGGTLKPFLSTYAGLLLPEVNQELWRRRHCPICGGSPDFACLDKNGIRRLLCSRCDTAWHFLRLECPYCGTQKQDALAYFTDGEESGSYRLYVCERCRTYIKTIDLRRTASEFLLPLERMMTLDMDRQAQEAGYAPGGYRKLSP